MKRRKCSAVRKCFRLRIHEARVCERWACCEPLFYAALSSSDAVECTCVMGLGENAGWRKPRTDVSGADIEENGKKNIYIVSCSRCKSMKKKKSRAELFYVCFSYLYSAAKVCILYMAI